jgi:general secretion pathway protein K
VAYRTRGARFEAVEDLLQVLGIDFDLYARVAPLFTADGNGAGVDPLAATPEVLWVLARGNANVVERILSARRSDGRLADSAGLVADHLGQPQAARIRLEAYVPVDDATMLIRSHLIDLSPQSDAPLPWRILGTETRYLAQAR